MSAVTLAQTDGVAVLTLDHPARSNALSDHLLADLHAALDRLPASRALVLRASGRHFSTGGDVARFAQEVAAGNGQAYAEAVVGGLNRAILRLAALPCPVLAEVQGALTGGALGLVLAADLVAMDRGAFIKPFYSTVGFAPDGGWTAMLPARIGAHRAREIQFLNRRIGADEALTLGLADQVCDDPAQVSAGWLAILADKLPGALAETRRLTTDLPALATALDAERDAFVARIDSAEARAGMARFLASLKGA